jgi:hypothetical protein
MDLEMRDAGVMGLVTFLAVQETGVERVAARHVRVHL